MSKPVYKDSFPALVVEMARGGKSMVQIAAEAGINKATWYGWASDDSKPEFQLAYKLAKTCYEAYWEGIGAQGAKGNLAKFCYPAWDRIMRSRCQDEWSESAINKIELKNELKSMTNKEIDEALKTLLAAKANNENNDGNSGAPASP